MFVEAQRNAAFGYPPSSFPDPASSLVDFERRAQFEEAGAHYESAYYLTFLYLPPAEKASRAEGWLYENRAREEGADALARCCAASSTAPAGCCSWSRASFRRWRGSPTPRR